MKTKNQPTSMFDGAPSLHHPEAIRPLYETGIRIDRQVLRDLLELPRETLLDDLGAVLGDARSRYHLCSEAYDASTDDTFLDQKLSFAIHAMLMLQEIDSSRSFDIALAFLGSENTSCLDNEEFTWFWLGDHLDRNVWQVFFRQGKGREHEMADFLFTPNVSKFSKEPIAIALRQITLHHPERKKFMHALYETTFKRLLIEIEKGAEFLVPVAAMIAADYLETRPDTVSPWIEAFLNSDPNRPLFTNDYSTIDKISAKLGVVSKMEYRGLFELYDHVCDIIDASEKSPTPASPFYSFPDYSEDPAPEPYIAGPKVGRNEPCPCGSGKKYKKCCLKHDEA